jgi:hypothetical protein
MRSLKPGLFPWRPLCSASFPRRASRGSGPTWISPRVATGDDLISPASSFRSPEDHRGDPSVRGITFRWRLSLSLSCSVVAAR